jgi:hypothetical protein
VRSHNGPGREAEPFFGDDASTLIISDSELRDTPPAWAGRRCRISGCQCPRIYCGEAPVLVKGTGLQSLGGNAITLGHHRNVRRLENELEDLDASAISILDECSGKVEDGITKDIQGNGIHVPPRAFTLSCSFSFSWRWFANQFSCDIPPTGARPAET